MSPPWCGETAEWSLSLRKSSFSSGTSQVRCAPRATGRAQSPTELQFGSDRFPFEGAFFDFAAGSDSQNLMGRRDFFSRYIIQFWDSQSLMNIDLSPDFPQGDGSQQLRP